MSNVDVEKAPVLPMKADVPNDINKMEVDTSADDKPKPVVDSSNSNGLTADKPEQTSVGETKLADSSESNAEEKKSAKDDEPANDKVDAGEPAKSSVKRKKAAEKADEGEGDATPKKKSKKESKKSEEKAEKAEKEKAPVKASPKKKPAKEVSSEDEDEDEEEEADTVVKPGLLERPVILEEGCKREKKKVQRLDVTPSQTERRLSIAEGTGTKLGDIPRVELQIQKFHGEELKPLHRLLFDRIGSATMVKKNIRQFSGFAFSEKSTEFTKKKEKLAKFTNPVLKTICETLDIERKGKKDEIIDRIMSYLMEPKSSGKPVPSAAEGKKRRRSSTAKKSSPRRRKSDSGNDKKKSKPTKKAEKASGDESVSGGDDDSEKSEKESEDEEEKKAEKSESEEEQEDEPSSDEDEPAKKKKKKATPAKKTPKAAGKKTPAKKTPKADAKKPAKKPATATKKKAQKKDESSDNSSDDDEPLEKKKGPPSDEVLKDVIKKILKTANLEEVTMKTVCKQVYEKYPEFDLTARKDFIKATVKQILK